MKTIKHILLASVLMGISVLPVMAADYGNTTTTTNVSTTTVTEHSARDVNAGIEDDLKVIIMASAAIAVLATIGYKLSYRWYLLG